MLRKPDKTIAYCLERASLAHERAAIADDPQMRVFHDQQSSRWMDLAASAALVERIDLFLTSLAYKKLSPADVCLKCNRRMRLSTVELTNEGERHIFECPDCGDRKVRQLEGH